MDTVRISDLDALKVIDRKTGEVSYGCSQEWYSTEWQRRSGCGPSVASDIFFYLCGRPGDGKSPRYREECSALMEDVWKYVTPTDRGIPDTEMFCGALCSYALSKGALLNYFSCGIPREAASRPSSGEIASFLRTALSADRPVAFLNLCNGKEKNLDRWHWVTVVSMECDRPVVLRVLDSGALKAIDLALWRDTTTDGGGFAYFSRAADPEPGP
jgi:hypothetical protein